MTHSPYPVVLDACVLYPSLLRDLLMYLGLTALYQPKWTDTIQDEWQRNLIVDRPDLDARKIKEVGLSMNQAIPDARVTGFETLITGIDLPDTDDRHVVAAAIRSNAEIIVTFNLKDFPAQSLDKFGIEALHPDDFITDLFDLNHALVLSAVTKQRRSMRMPAKTADEYLAALPRQGLPQTAKLLGQFHLLI